MVHPRLHGLLHDRRYNGLPAGMLNMTMRLKMPEKPKPKVAMRSITAMGRLVRKSMTLGAAAYRHEDQAGGGSGRLAAMGNLIRNSIAGPRPSMEDVAGAGDREGPFAAMGRLIKKSISHNPPEGSEAATGLNRGSHRQGAEDGSSERRGGGGGDRSCGGSRSTGVSEAHGPQRPSGSADAAVAKLAAMQSLLRTSMKAGMSLLDGVRRMSIDSPSSDDIQSEGKPQGSAMDRHSLTHPHAGGNMATEALGFGRPPADRPIKKPSRFSLYL